MGTRGQHSIDMFDVEWMVLMKEARDAGLTADEVRRFLQQPAESRVVEPQRE